MDLLGKEWAAGVTIQTVLRSILLMMSEPYPYSPPNRDAAVLYANNRPKYDDTVRRWTRMYAMPEPEVPERKEPPHQEPERQEEEEQA